ncbi:MAG: hypothetical protein JWO89_1626 [Verrucomicrobiaceae bacterium]|nr:hypothetical protein [Verrucomicrobiaceae bacterium]
MSEALFDPEVLIQHYVEGTLTDAEAVHLHELLKTDAALGDRLLNHVSMDAMVRSTKELKTLQLVRAAALLPKRRFSFMVLSGVAAAAACITLLGAWILRQAVDLKASSYEATTASVAVLTRGVNLEWETDSIAPMAGSPLSPGWLRLKSGLAQIEFYQGARVLIEGPAALQLVSSGEAYCTAGKLSAHVPPQAKGFRINTPKGAIVDLGTEFGLDLNDASSQVHVFKGEVELHRPASPMQSVKEGQAATFAAPTVLAANVATFASLNDLVERTAVSQRSQFQRWQAASTGWNNDPSLRLRFDFQDNVESRSLQNLARKGQGVPDGSIVGGAWTEGRWPGKRALEFRNVSDRVRLSLPSDVESLTMATWVRVNGLDRAFNSLFMCEGWGGGKIHWQITREGRVRLGISSRDSKPHVDYDTPPLFTPERFGQWMHLAVVFDPTAKEVRHYANGEVVAKLPVKALFPLHLSMAELGNWNDGHVQRVAIRHLSGAMDEFSLYTRALGDAELAEQYRDGSPEQR